MAVGLIALFAIQVMINLGVVVGLFPVTGITLPFISYGGSSLVVMMSAMGLLISIARAARRTNEGEACILRDALFHVFVMHTS